MNALGEVADPAAAAADTMVKAEPASEAAKTEKDVQQLMESPLPFLRRFQDYCSETKLIIAKAEHTKYAATMLSEAQVHMTRMKKVTKMLDNLIGGEPPLRDGMVKLIATMEQLTEAQLEIESFAVKLGCMKEQKRVQKRK